MEFQVIILIRELITKIKNKLIYGFKFKCDNFKIKMEFLLWVFELIDENFIMIKGLVCDICLDCLK